MPNQGLLLLPVTAQLCADQCNPPSLEFAQGAYQTSSAWAKKADAVLRISFARRNSLFSFSRAFLRSSSSDVAPGFSPASIWVRLSHAFRLSGEHSIFAAIDWIACYCEGYSPSCSSTMRTARSQRQVLDL